MRRATLAAAVVLLGAAAAHADQLDDALARARRTDRAVVLEFRASWCGPCHVFARHVLASERVQADLRRRIFLSVDVDAPEGERLSHRFGVVVIPTFVSLDPSGEVLERSFGIVDVASPDAFIALFDRAEIERVFRRHAHDPRLARLAGAYASEVRLSPGTWRAGWALARAVVTGQLAPDEQSELFRLHADRATDPSQVAFTIYTALLAGGTEDAAAIADRLIARGASSPTTLAAAGHAFAAANRPGDAHQLMVRCNDAARGRAERWACHTLGLRVLFGRTALSIELVRYAARLRLLAELGARAGDADAAELAAERAVWGQYPAGVIERADVTIPDRAGTLWLHRGLVAALIAARADRGLSGDGRFQVGGRGLLALRRGYEVKPMGLVTAELGMDFADEITYEGSLQIGFSVAGGVLGIYSGICASDPGAGAGGALGIPLELALSYPAERFGVEAFVRSTVIVAGDEPRADGSENAPFAADELSFGAAARVPDTRIMVGIRHDQLLDRTLTGLWLGLQLAP